MSEVQPPLPTEPRTDTGPTGAKPPSANARIYDRPERKGPSPILLGIALVVLLLAGFLLYKVYHPTMLPVHAQIGLVSLSQTSFGFASKEVTLYP